jgi:hypothetical protein
MEKYGVCPLGFIQWDFVKVDNFESVLIDVLLKIGYV